MSVWGTHYDGTLDRQPAVSAPIPGSSRIQSSHYIAHAVHSGFQSRLTEAIQEPSSCLHIGPSVSHPGYTRATPVPTVGGVLVASVPAYRRKIVKVLP